MSSANNIISAFTLAAENAEKTWSIIEKLAGKSNVEITLDTTDVTFIAYNIASSEMVRLTIPEEAMDQDSIERTPWKDEKKSIVVTADFKPQSLGCAKLNLNFLADEDNLLLNAINDDGSYFKRAIPYSDTPVTECALDLQHRVQLSGFKSSDFRNYHSQLIQVDPHLSNEVRCARFAVVVRDGQLVRRLFPSSTSRTSVADDTGFNWPLKPGDCLYDKKFITPKDVFVSPPFHISALQSVFKLFPVSAGTLTLTMSPDGTGGDSGVMCVCQEGVLNVAAAKVRDENGGNKHNYQAPPRCGSLVFVFGTALLPDDEFEPTINFEVPPFPVAKSAVADKRSSTASAAKANVMPKNNGGLSTTVSKNRARGKRQRYEDSDSEDAQFAAALDEMEETEEMEKIQQPQETLDKPPASKKMKTYNGKPKNVNNA